MNNVQVGVLLVISGTRAFPLQSQATLVPGRPASSLELTSDSNNPLVEHPCIHTAYPEHLGLEELEMGAQPGPARQTPISLMVAEAHQGQAEGRASSQQPPVCFLQSNKGSQLPPYAEAGAWVVLSLYLILCNLFQTPSGPGCGDPLGELWPDGWLLSSLAGSQ